MLSQTRHEQPINIPRPGACTEVSRPARPGLHTTVARSGWLPGDEPFTSARNCSSVTPGSAFAVEPRRTTSPPAAARGAHVDGVGGLRVVGPPVQRPSATSRSDSPRPDVVVSRHRGVSRRGEAAATPGASGTGLRTTVLTPTGHEGVPDASMMADATCRVRPRGVQGRRPAGAGPARVADPETRRV